MRGGCRRVDRSESREKRESPGADIREGERSASGEERRGAERAAHRCQPALCLGADGGGVTLTRRGGGVWSSPGATGAAATLSAPSLFTSPAPSTTRYSRPALLSERPAMDVMRDGGSDLA